MEVKELVVLGMDYLKGKEMKKIIGGKNEDLDKNKVKTMFGDNCYNKIDVECALEVVITKALSQSEPKENKKC